MDKGNRKINPMLCPVCGKFEFEELDDLYYEHLGINDANEFQCRECGWYYDLEQTNDPDLENQANEMSLNQYRAWYQEKLKENPDYEYWEEQAGDPEPHPCPLCGEYMFPDEGSDEICPICGWQDTGFEEFPDEPDSEGQPTFNQHKKIFEEARQKDPNFRWKECKNKKELWPWWSNASDKEDD